MTKVQMTLIENSNSFTIDALSRAIAAEKNSSDWKFAILSLIQAIEIAVKERLRRDHKVLVYADIDSPKHSVSLEVALKRLIKICDITLSESELNAINTARNWRNMITHYEFEFSISTIKGVFSVLFGFLVDFNRKHLNQNLQTVIPNELWLQAVGIKSYFIELIQRAQVRINEEAIGTQRIRGCWQCGAYTFVLAQEGDKILLSGHCYACGFGEDLGYCEICTGIFSFDDLEFVQIGGKGNEIWGHICKDYCLQKVL